MMDMGICHHAYACSSLMLGSFGEITTSGESSYTSGLLGEEDFYKKLHHRVERDMQYDNYNGHAFSDFAFVVASTSQNQPNTEKTLEEVGFWRSERVEKQKNPDQDCTFWCIPVYRLVEGAKKYNIDLTMRPR